MDSLIKDFLWVSLAGLWATYIFVDDSVAQLSYYAIVLLTPYLFWLYRESIASFLLVTPTFFFIFALYAKTIKINTDIPFVKDIEDVEISNAAMFLYLVGMISILLGIKLASISKWKIPKKGVIFQRMTNLRLLLGLFILSNTSYVLAMIKVGGAPLLDLGLRWSLDPKLLFLGDIQVYVLPLILYRIKDDKRYTSRMIRLIVPPLILMGLLGARNPLFKLILAATIFNVAAKKWDLNRVILYLAVFGLGGYLIVGVYSKSGIYDVDLSLDLIVALFSMDALGTLGNFSQIVNIVPPEGLFHGQLLFESVLKMVPGFDWATYANNHIGKLLGQGADLIIAGTAVNVQVSLSPTLFGVPYADFGIAGLVFQSLGLGFLVGALKKLADQDLFYAAILSAVGVVMVYATYAGYYGADLLYVLFLGWYLVLRILVRSAFLRIQPRSKHVRNLLHN